MRRMSANPDLPQAMATDRGVLPPPATIMEEPDASPQAESPDAVPESAKPASQRPAAPMRRSTIGSASVARQRQLLEQCAICTAEYPGLSEVISLINSVPDNMQQKLEKDLFEMQENRRRLQELVKTNYELQRDLDNLDNKIKMLIRNRITVEDINTGFGHLLEHNFNQHMDRSLNFSNNQMATLPQDVKGTYGNMFCLLQQKPRYLAALARRVRGLDGEFFLRTVVLTIYGDQYNNHDERLLLSMFQLVLREEFRNGELGSFMRSNTCVTSMLSTYARRPGSIQAITAMIGPVIEEIMECSDSWELNPHKVYTEVIKEWEEENGAVSDMRRDLPQEEMAAHPEVARRCQMRMERIQGVARRLIDALSEGVPNVLYGVRWLCSQLDTMARERFQDATEAQIASIIGGLFFLRFVNPIIVAPDGNSIVSAKPSKTARRNLMLVAKVMQNLSNGIAFGSKEEYMQDFNPFLEEMRPRVMALFAALIDVEDITDALAMDSFLLVNTVDLMAGKRLAISYNEVVHMHQLLTKNKLEVASGPQDPLMRVLFALGPAPGEVKRGQNSMLTLDLVMPTFSDGELVAQKPQRHRRVSVWDAPPARKSQVQSENSISGLNLGEGIREISEQEHADEEFRRQTKLLMSTVFQQANFEEDQMEAFDAGGLRLANLLEHVREGEGEGESEGEGEGGSNFARSAKKLVEKVAQVVETDMGVLSQANARGVALVAPASSLAKRASGSFDAGRAAAAMTDWSLVTTPEHGERVLVNEVYRAYKSMIDSLGKVNQNIERLDSAMEVIKGQHERLVDQLKMYKQYLESAREQCITEKHSQPQRLLHLSIGRSQPKNKSEVRVSYKDLTERGVIVDSHLADTIRQNISFRFRRSDQVPGRFDIEAYVNGALAQSTSIFLDELLQDQADGKATVDLEDVTLNCNMLIHLLNNDFS